jgi:hypothetical protein
MIIPVAGCFLDAGEEDELPTVAVRLHLAVAEGDPPLARVQLQLSPEVAPAEVDSGAEVAPDSSFASSDASSSDSDDEASAGAESEDEPLDVVENYEQLKQMIADMDAKPAAALDDDDDDEDGGGDGGGAAHRAERELLGAAPLPSLAGVEVARDDPVTAAGEVQTMLEGMIVIKASFWKRRDSCLLHRPGTAMPLPLGPQRLASFALGLVQQALLHRAAPAPTPALLACPAAGSGRQPRAERGFGAGAGGSHPHRVHRGDFWAGCGLRLQPPPRPSLLQRPPLGRGLRCLCLHQCPALLLCRRIRTL